MIFYILALVISTLIFIIIPILFIVFIYFLLSKKVNKGLAIFLTSILISIFSYYLFTNFYPRDSFYSDNVKENTKLILPKSAKLIANSGNNSIYDFGGYNISYMYQFSELDYDKLYAQLLDKGFKQTNIYLETTANDKLLSLKPSLKEDKILNKGGGYKNFEVLFLNDNKTILFNSNRW